MQKVKQIGTFTTTEDKTYHFNGCDTCDAQCCKGANSVHIPIVLSDFEKVYEHFVIAFMIGSMGYVKACILLNDGLNSCRYLKDDRCSIYDKRPLGCQVYPLSPTIYNEAYVDTFCPSINDQGIGSELISNTKITHPSFQNDLFTRYQDEYLASHHHFMELKTKGSFVPLVEIKEMPFFKYEGEMNDKYMQMHAQSLCNLPHIQG